MRSVAFANKQTIHYTNLNEYFTEYILYQKEYSTCTHTHTKNKQTKWTPYFHQHVLWSRWRNKAFKFASSEIINEFREKSQQTKKYDEILTKKGLIYESIVINSIQFNFKQKFQLSFQCKILFISQANGKIDGHKNTYYVDYSNIKIYLNGRHRPDSIATTNKTLINIYKIILQKWIRSFDRQKENCFSYDCCQTAIFIYCFVKMQRCRYCKQDSWTFSWIQFYLYPDIKR